MTTWLGRALRPSLGRHYASAAVLDTEPHDTLSVSLPLSVWEELYDNGGSVLRSALNDAAERADRKTYQPFGFTT